MKSERPLIASVLFLAAGMTLLFGYCSGASSFNLAYPFAASAIHLDITTTGPAAIGGVALTLAGALLLAWALVAAILDQITAPFRHSREDLRITSDDRIRTSDRILE
jgi:hypothetical protein